MLEYEKQIFLDILQDDGLVIAAKGLGLESVVVNLLKVYCDPGNLVFVLGTDGKDQDWIVSTLKAQGVNPAPHVVTSDLGVGERANCYLEGGVWMVPTRILIVDFIKKRIPVDLITGFIVWKAHKILQAHQEAFVLRLYRLGNKTGFIKAFSNFAPAFKQGFSKTEYVMKALFVRNLFLWPRYHAAVKSCLAECKPHVVELHLEMTSSMLQLQNCLLDLIKTTVQELKRLNPTLDTEEVTVENALHKAFHKSLHSQLDPVWHALSERTKLLVTDLKLFHYFIMSLINLDSVAFYSIINSQRKSERALKGSGWHFHPSTEILFTVSRERVFGQNKDTLTIDPEPNPKWTMLAEVLSEIHKNIKEEQKIKREKENVEKNMEEMFEEEGVSTEKTDENVEKVDECILILVREKKTCWQLRLYLTMGSKQLLQTQYRKCFGNKMPAKLNTDTLKSQTEDNEQESEAVIEDELLDEDENELNCEFVTLSLTQATLQQLDTDNKVNLAGCFEESFSLTQAEKGAQANKSIANLTQSNSSAPTIMIHSFNRDWMSLSKNLQEMKPKWIIMYDSDVTIVRQIEVYQRNNRMTPITVYFLIYGGTVEEQAYLTALRKEKEAFDNLIAEKTRIVIPENLDDFYSLNRDSRKASELVDNTRKGGVEGDKKETPRVIVDMREFRSELPALIHGRGIDIEPHTLTVGDYVLSPDICLERKSISDLIQSLSSGRLYSQALAMTRHYTRPMLLIEFDKDKPFDLQDRYYLSKDSSSELLVTKLQLLTLHFPQLRLVWSPSPQATAQLFEELKQDRPEPDLSTAASFGVEQTATDEDKFNPGIHALMLKLPGVTTKNIYTILRKIKSLDQLKTLSVEELAKLLENTSDAQKVYDGIHKKHSPVEAAAVGGLSKVRGKIGVKRKRFH